MKKFAAKTAAVFALTTATFTAHAAPIQMQDTEIRDFVRWYVEQSNTPLAIHPAATGTLTVYAPDVPDHQLDEFFQGVLSSHGYTILPGNPPTVAPVSQANNTPAPVATSSPTQAQAADVIANPPTLTPRLEPQATHLFPFDNVRADDVAPLVTTFLTQDTQQGTTLPHVQVLHASNAILAKGSEKQLERLEAMLPQVDVSHPQILIQAVIFETTDGDTFDLGVSLGRATGSGIAGGFNTANLGTSLATSGGSFGIFDGNVLAFAINALQRDSSSNVLSTPQILTLSGKRGTISIGQNVPFVTGRVTGESADVNSPFQTIERRDIGIRLNVLPVVTASGLVIMEITTSADSLTDSVLASDIITNQRQINTTVQIRSGQTLLLGGLSSQNDQQQVSGVPGLQSIPLAGRLFQNESNSRQRTNLHVLLQATVLPRFDPNQRAIDSNATQTVAGLIATSWRQEVETLPVTRLAE